MSTRIVNVNITPETIRSFAKWKLVDTSDETYESKWQDSDDSLSVPYGEYNLIGKEIAGWTLNTESIPIIDTNPDSDFIGIKINPENIEKDIKIRYRLISSLTESSSDSEDSWSSWIEYGETSQEVLIVTLNYIQHGNLKINIQSDSAKTDGRWRVVETEVWYSDGDEIDLMPDSYEIEFKDINNHTTPTNQIINVKSNNITTKNISYIAYGTLQVNIFIDNHYYTDSPKWKIKDYDEVNNTSDIETWRSNTEYVGLPVGTYTIEFNIVDNTYTHGDVEVTISNTTTNTQSINYIGLQLFVIPSNTGLHSYNYNNLKRQDLLELSNTNICQVQFNNSKTLIAIALNESPYLMIYDCFDYNELHDFNLQKPTSGCRCLEFSSDDQYLIVSYNNYPYITIYETDTWETVELDESPTSYCNAIEFDILNQTLVLGYNKYPYISSYTLTPSGSSTSFNSINITDLPNDSVLSLKHNNDKLLVGCQNELIIYNSSFEKTDIDVANYLEGIDTSGGIYGIEIINDDELVLIASLYLYVCQFNRGTYKRIYTNTSITPNINTHIKKDSINEYLVISGLRDPSILIYDTSTWKEVIFSNKLGYCKKFDISDDLSDRSYINTPTNIAPDDNIKGLQLGTNLESSDFNYFTNLTSITSGSSETMDTHEKSQWRIYLEDDTIVEDILSFDDLISIQIPSICFEDVISYKWQVRHKGVNFGWSMWSIPTSFITTYAYIIKPVNQNPVADEIDIVENVTLIGNTFTTVNLTDTHLYTEWKILDGSSNFVYTSGAVTELSTYTLPLGILEANTIYSWQHRCKGDLIGWSEWSIPSSFTTGYWEVIQPINIYPTDLQIDVDGNNTILKSSQFSVSSITGQHILTRWEIYSDSDLTNLIYTSGEQEITNDGGEIQFSLPIDIILNNGVTYYWRVAYKDYYYNWSIWSNVTSLTTKMSQSTVKVNIVPDTYKWRWKLNDPSGIYSSYISSGIDVNIDSNQNITINFEERTGYTTPNDININLLEDKLYEAFIDYDEINGSLRVNLNPDSDTAWRISGGAWRPSNYTEVYLSYGDYTVQYKTLYGYDTPSDESITINSQIREDINSVYTLLTGGILVTLSTTAGRWRISGGSWNTSGSTVENLSYATYTIQYKSLSGFITPSEDTITIDSTTTESLSKTYTLIDEESGSIQITFNIAGAWRISGEVSWNTSEDTVTGLSYDDYDIEYQDVSGYITPLDETITIDSQDIKELDKNYYLVGTEFGSIKIILEPDTGTAWRILGGSWIESGESEINLTDGIYHIEYKDLTDYTTPPNEEVIVELHETTTLITTYDVIQYGSLMVTLIPSLNTHWSFSGKSWKSSGYVEEDLPYGIYTIIYETKSGYMTPASENVTINSSTTKEIITPYYSAFEYVGNLKITIDPSLNSYWRIPGKSWRTSGYSEDNLSYSDYVIEYKAPTGYISLTNEMITIDSQGTKELERTFSEEVIITPIEQYHIQVMFNLKDGEWRIKTPRQEILWHKNKESIILDENTYTIEFKDIEYHITPNDLIIELTDDRERIEIEYARESENYIELKISDYDKYVYKYRIGYAPFIDGLYDYTLRKICDESIETIYNCREGFYNLDVYKLVEEGGSIKEKISTSEFEYTGGHLLLIIT
jgi:hypothetical protein